jgi:hypothetical protein
MEKLSFELQKKIINFRNDVTFVNFSGELINNTDLCKKLENKYAQLSIESKINYQNLKKSAHNYCKVLKENQIILDGILFEIISYGIGENLGNRHLVALRSIDSKGEETYFACYRSNSEGGFFRLCLFVFNSLEKGFHYVIASFIDMRLQMFMNNYLKNKVFDKNFKSACKFSQSIYEKKYEDFGKFLIYKEKNYIEANKHVYDESRLEKSKAFDVLVNCKIGECLNFKVSLEYFKTNLVTNKEIAKIMDELMQNYKKPLSSIDTLRIIFKTISNYLQRNLTYNKNSLEYIENFTSKFDENVSFSHRIYKILIKENSSDKEYILYFSQYKTTLKGFSDEYTIPIIVVPVDSKATKYGTYEKVVDVSIYNHKIMEYQHQIKVNCYEGDDAKRNLGRYCFIGDLASDMWPMNTKEFRNQLR